LVSPANFIPVAEETGLIIPIGEWVLQEACIQAKQWQLTFGQQAPLTINVNLSGRQLVQPDLTAKIDQILRETGIERQSLKLEITESAFIENADWLGNQPAGDRVIDILQQLRSLGVQLGIDDFGTGYSSLSRLYRFPINTLKIDQSFIKSMELSCEEHSHTSSCKIVRAIIGLAHNLGLDVTAEGIETFQQLDQLRKLGCEFGQGYFFSEPVNAIKAEALIAAQPQW
jgi:EAL domain-containing protein (putative c-di-GMP-specific phosphodiesterase class I)